MEIKELLSRLGRPFENIKWKVQSSNDRYAICVAYIDSRAVQNRLDEECVWQDRYKELGNGKIYCEIGIKVGEEWIWRSDTGTPSKMEGDKGLASDAFKRAAVKWNIGRDIYEMDVVMFNKTQKVGNVYVPVSNKGKALKTGSLLTDHINKMRGGRSGLELALIKELEGVKSLKDFKELTSSLQPVFSKRKAALNA